MADQTLTDLAELTGPVAADWLYIVPEAGGVDRKVSVGNVLALAGTGDLLDFTFVQKALDESLNTNIVLQDDDELLFAIGANEVWTFEFNLFLFSTSGTPDIFISLGIPSGTFSAGVQGVSTAATSAAGSMAAFAFLDQASGGGSFFSLGIPANATVLATFKGVVINGATPGNAVLQWAQNSSNGTNTTVKAKSYLMAHRVL